MYMGGIKDKKEKKREIIPPQILNGIQRRRLLDLVIKRNTCSETRVKTERLEVRKGNEEVPVVWLQWTQFRTRENLLLKRSWKKILLTTKERKLLFNQNSL